ncbi:MAG: HesB/IscA family protein, partial [Sandaracinobacter sp.]
MTTVTTDRPPARPRPAPITLTPGAQQRIADLIAKAPMPVAGVRLSTPKRGCSGLAYSIDYVEAAKPGDEAIETPSGTLFVDGGSLLYLIGSVMDWKEDYFTAGFVFQNPNPKGTCGCGESFTV